MAALTELVNWFTDAGSAADSATPRAVNTNNSLPPASAAIESRSPQTTQSTRTAPSAAEAPGWAVGNVIGLNCGTSIRVGQGDASPVTYTVQENNYQVYIKDGLALPMARRGGTLTAEPFPAIRTTAPAGCHNSSRKPPPAMVGGPADQLGRRRDHRPVPRHRDQAWPCTCHPHDSARRQLARKGHWRPPFLRRPDVVGHQPQGSRRSIRWHRLGKPAANRGGL